jgi:hypothetical protein
MLRTMIAVLTLGVVIPACSEKKKAVAEEEDDDRAKKRRKKAGDANEGDQDAAGSKSGRPAGTAQPPRAEGRRNAAPPEQQGVECAEDSDCPGTGPVCEAGKCVGAGSSPVPIEESSPNDLAADGWPQTFPPPGSSAPSVAEWNAVPREVTVWGSSALRCETKMVREWLRISCRANHLGVPIAVSHEPAFGQQALKFVAEGQVASVVLQMIPGKNYDATFTWSSPNSEHVAQTVTIRWNQGRPAGRFQDSGGG